MCVTGDASKLLVTVMDYLRRKTNFFKEGDSQKRVLDAYRQVGICMGAWTVRTA